MKKLAPNHNPLDNQEMQKGKNSQQIFKTILQFSFKMDCKLWNWNLTTYIHGCSRQIKSTN
jgi:hypothetical protein